MKQKNSLFKIVASFVMFCMMTGFIASKAEVNPLLFAGCIIVLAVLFKRKESSVYRCDGVYTEIWIGELIKRFKFKREWLNLIPRYDKAAKNKVIHLVEIGADPEVFINLVIDKDNPVPIAHRADNDIPISLDKYDTANTMITLDELRGISYDKMAATLELHMEKISAKAATKAVHRLSATNQDNILATTGNSDERPSARKRITPDDIVRISELTNTPTEEGGPDWPEGEGVALLDFRHVADLQKLDQTFEKQWRNAQTGEIFDYNGFKIMKFNRNPKYIKNPDGTFTLKAFGSAIDAANDCHSSLFFLPQRAFAAADASPEMFYKIATTDPQYRANTVGFQHWNVVAKKKADGFFQLVSDKI